MPYILTERGRRTNRKFGTEEISFSARINPSQIPTHYNDQSICGAIEFLHMLLDALLAETTRNLDDEDYIRYVYFWINFIDCIYTKIVLS